MPNPKVSVIMPYYNKQGMSEEKLVRDLLYIKEAIDSFANQTLRDTELIFVDDGAHDKRVTDYVKARAKTDPRIRVIESPTNVGTGPARNLALKARKGEFVKFLDADDALPATDILEFMYKKAKEHDAQVVSGYTNFVEEDMKTHLRDDVPPYSTTWADGDRATTKQTADANKPVSLGDPDAEGILQRDFLADAIYASKLFDDTDLFPAGKWEDHAFIPVLKAKAERMVAIDRPVYNYRFYTDNETATNMRNKTPALLDIVKGTFSARKKLEEIYRNNPEKLKAAQEYTKRAGLLSNINKMAIVAQWGTSETEKHYFSKNGILTLNSN